jgi:hypothetical protein
LAIVTLLFASASASAQVDLGTAQDFGVLGGSTVTNTGATVVTGDLGVSPGTAITGFPPGLVVGTIHVADAVAIQAQADANAAFNQISGLASGVDLTGQDLGGLTLVPGVYTFSSSAQLTGDLTLDAQGSGTAEFIFQIGTTLTTASASTVALINGGGDCNVYWQVGSSATLGTSSTFLGNVLASASITVTTSTDVTGRLLALNGAVTLDTNDITSTCCDIDASWALYGQGYAGSAGIPTLLPRTDPEQGTTITLDLTNGAGHDTIGVLFVGLAKASIPFTKGGDLLVDELFSVIMLIPTAGLSLDFVIPNEDDLCGVHMYAQMIECDGSTHRFSATQGVDFTFGH